MEEAGTEDRIQYSSGQDKFRVLWEPGLEGMRIKEDFLQVVMLELNVSQGTAGAKARGEGSIGYIEAQVGPSRGEPCLTY